MITTSSQDFIEKYSNVAFGVHTQFYHAIFVVHSIEQLTLTFQ